MGLFSFGGKSAATGRERVGTTGRTTRGESAERRGSRSRSARSERGDRGDTHGMLDPTIPEKHRARRRLVGAVALALAAIVILPMVLDSHPRPMTDDISIAIPDQKPAAHADTAAASTNGGPAPNGDADAADAGATAALADDNPRDAAVSAGTSTAAPANTAAAAGLATPTTSAAAPRTRVANAASGGAAARTSSSVASRANRATHTDNPANAADPIGAFAANDAGSGNAGNASSNPSNPSSSNTFGNPNTRGGGAAAPTAAAVATNSRFVVQLGSTASAAQAAAWVSRLKALGVPAYSQSSRLADGSERLTLRAGPFSDRASAEAAVRKVRQAGLSSQSGA
ncbi:MAG: SPOR domain-containing protein [Janthinobacterium lividum]